MKPKTGYKLYSLQRRLRVDSFSLYKRVMSELFKHHEDHDFVHRLRNYFRTSRFDKALEFAELLSEQTYSDATTHFVAAQFAQLIRKYPWDPEVVKTDPESKAIGKFLSSEHRCLWLNRKFSLYDKYRSPHEYLLSRMRSFIRYTIGDSPPMDLIYSNCNFGAGASLGVHGDATNLLRKLSVERFTVTPSAFTHALVGMWHNPYLRDVLSEERNGFSCLDFEAAEKRLRSRALFVNHNKISFVPKTAITHRAIAVEPLLNGFLQKGTDVAMRLFLKRIGIDLSDQSINQHLARSGSFDDCGDDTFTTIDLSSASDSISIGLVKSLLPPDWYDFLYSIRSPSYMLGNRVYPYHKFCSMGNGFCFPLETLIFAACCHAVDAGKAGTDFSVYGDDIIVRKVAAGKALELLKVLGFSPNANKTFISGPFRESCGADWFGGVDVRPYILDYSLDSLENLFKWLNLTRRNELTTRFFAGTEDIILSSIPDQFQFWRPFKGNPDSGIDSYGSEHLTSKNCFFERRSMTWICRQLMVHPKPDKGYGVHTYRRSSVDMYALLSGVSSRHYEVGYTYRRKTRTTVSSARYGAATSNWLPSL
jgi:hypothetical protein